jgi:enterochelin esterase-like enzyme
MKSFLLRLASLVKLRIALFVVLPLTIMNVRSQAQEVNPPFLDITHVSRVFGHPKYYRLYLPAGYNKSEKRYPVIYFFHGWGGRYFKDDNAKLEYAKLKDLVDKYQVILVMWDGNIGESEPRPYNIGNHKDIKYQVQMKDYFPELVAHIDSAYRTLTDRNHRGIIGFSMGGIMSFFLAGKYPDKVCAAVNLAGTPEFFIGYPENHTLYPVRYTFINLMDVNTRQQGGDSDILVYLNEEVRKGAEWEGNPYEFWGFHGGHMIDKTGETKSFEMAMNFVVKSFGKEPMTPERWSHYDIYDRFDVWGYRVESNKTVPGFLYLKNVGKKGFGFYTRQWLPDGPAISNIYATISTAPQYIPGKTYNIIAIPASDRDTIVRYRVACRSDRRLIFQETGDGWDYGIYTNEDTPEFIAQGYEVENHGRYLIKDQHNQLSVRLINRGGEVPSAQKITVTIQTADSAIKFNKNVVNADIRSKQRIILLPPFDIACSKLPPLHGEPFQVKFKITVQTGNEVFNDEIIVPVLFDGPLFTDLQIDDGRPIRDKAYGTGNGNGSVEAGEKILIYSGDHRLRLYTDDPWVISGEEKLVDEQIPAIWEDGFTLSSVIAISKDCPEGHVIEFTGNYETNTYNPIERNLHWGKVRITVTRLK